MEMAVLLWQYVDLDIREAQAPVVITNKRNEIKSKITRNTQTNKKSRNYLLDSIISHEEFESKTRCSGFFPGEAKFAFLPRVHVGLFQVLCFPPTVQEHAGKEN